MPTLSDNYGFAVGMVTDDFIEPGQVDRPARTLDRVLGAIARQLLSGGVYTGWELELSQTVSAGSGLVSGAWGETALDQAITGLSAGAVNYVFALATADTAPLGEVAFVAQFSPAPPPGALYLGTITLDGEGLVSELDSHAPGVSRGCFPLLAATLSGSGTVASVGGGETVSVEISHTALALPGAISFTIAEEHFSFFLDETWRGDGFVAEVTNEDTEAHELVYEWVRRGVSG